MTAPLERASCKRAILCARVLIQEIPTLISVTRTRVCELDGGHEWDEWEPDALLEVFGDQPMNGSAFTRVMRRCELCGVTEHGVQQATMRVSYPPSPNQC